MVRGDKGELKFGFREWLTVVAALVGIFSTLIGGLAGWYDVKARHDVAVARLERLAVDVIDHETRIRRLEGQGRAEKPAKTSILSSVQGQ